MGAFDLQSEYFVRFRNYSEDVVVFNYQRDERLLVPTGYQNLVYLEETSIEVDWVFMGNYVLNMDSDGRIQVGELTSRPRSNDFPRLDFCRRFAGEPRVLASLHTNGRFYVPVADESDPPVGTDQMLFFGKISIGLGGLFADSIEEIGLLTDEAGNYVSVDDSGTMIQV